MLAARAQLRLPREERRLRPPMHPVEGGCANDYVYVFGDPVNDSDLDGMGVREWLKERWRNAKNIERGVWRAVSRNVFTCADTTFTRTAGALSLFPPFGKAGFKRAWGGSGASWLNFVVGYGAWELLARANSVLLRLWDWPAPPFAWAPGS